MENLSTHYGYHGLDQVQVVNGNTLLVSHIGSLVIHSSTHSFHLNNIMRVPTMTKSLLFVGSLLKIIVLFLNSTIFGVMSGIKRAAAFFFKRQLGIVFIFFTMSFVSPYTHARESKSINIQQSCLGHPSNKVLVTVGPKNQLPFSSSISSFCEACHCNKSKQLPLKSSSSTCNNPLESIQSDIWAPSLITSNGGHHYYIHFTNQFSQFMWIFPLY